MKSILVQCEGGRNPAWIEKGTWKFTLASQNTTLYLYILGTGVPGLDVEISQGRGIPGFDSCKAIRSVRGLSNCRIQKLEALSKFQDPEELENSRHMGWAMPWS